MSTLEERQQIKRSSPQIILKSEHTQNCRVVPTRQLLLDHLPKQAVVAEIGVAFGDFTKHILERTVPSKLHLIDVWSSARYREGLEQIKTDLDDQIQSGMIEINQGLSTDMLQTFEDDYFDWVYIDTDHTYSTTSSELELARQKVKPGGKISGDDFTSGNPVTPWPYGVIEACHEFCDKYDWQYELISFEPSGHFSFILREI